MYSITERQKQHAQNIWTLRFTVCSKFPSGVGFFAISNKTNQFCLPNNFLSTDRIWRINSVCQGYEFSCYKVYEPGINVEVCFVPTHVGSKELGSC